MRDPSLQENPFLSDYDEWDLWCYKNVHDYGDTEFEEYYEGLHPDWVALDGGITGDGWLVPQSSSLKEGMEYSLGYYPRYGGGDDGCAASLSAVGPMDDETKSALLQMRSRVRAPYILPVPKWLAAAPPKVARFIPDGNFALLGEPGSGISLDNAFFGLYNEPPSTDDVWQLYDPEGELLETGKPGEHWWQLYFKDFTERTGLDPADDDSGVYEYGGLVSAYDPETYDYTFAFTYKGEELEDMYEDRPEIDPREFTMLFGPEIPLIHAYQLEVEPRLPCGMGIGVETAGELDQSQLIAMGNSPTSYKPLYIAVKPINDADNPYTGLYEEWDTAIYENHLWLVAEHDFNKHLPDDAHDGGFAIINSVINLVAEEDQYNVKDFYLLVDDEGWLIPHRVGQELEYSWQIDEPSSAAEDAANRSYCGFRLQSAGPMEDELYLAYQSVLYQLQAAGLPQIPDWLAKNPPMAVRMLPTGEFITRGGLGTGEKYDPEMPWVHYSSTGDELGRIPAGSNWFELTFPGFRAIVEELGGEENVEYYDYHGVIELMTTDTEDYTGPAAVYSYTGVEMEIAEYDYTSLYFEEIPGEFLPAMREAQLEK